MAAKKYYVVWKGHEPGIYDSWDKCKRQVANFPGAEYKSFKSKEQAESAFYDSYLDHKGKNTSKPVLSEAEKQQYGTPNYDSISVDAACSGNPGLMEYQGVLTATGDRIFHQGPFQEGTNNVGEFLAIVHALALLQQQGQPQKPIYTDSRIAMGWVAARQCRTKLDHTPNNQKLWVLIKRAEAWLQNNRYSNPIIKWETKAWGEIPADFGRK